MSASKSRRESFGNADDPKLSKVVNYLTPMHDDIVDAVIKIMDGNGPQPMRNMKPAQKLPTGAERFKIEHHGEYEARAQQSKSKVSRVVAHNMAYPKLHDELEKRRSVAQPTVIPVNRKQSLVHSPHKQLKSKPKKTNNRRHTSRKITRPQKGIRITKPKAKVRRRYRSEGAYKLSRIRTSKGCQCYQRTLVEKSVATFKDFGSAPGIMAGNSEVKAEPENDLLTKIKTEPKSEIDTSIQSISSYNSYLSMDHEPMVE